MQGAGPALPLSPSDPAGARQAELPEAGIGRRSGDGGSPLRRGSGGMKGAGSPLQRLLQAVAPPPAEPPCSLQPQSQLSPWGPRPQKGQFTNLGATEYKSVVRGRGGWAVGWPRDGGTPASTTSSSSQLDGSPRLPLPPLPGLQAAQGEGAEVVRRGRVLEPALAKVAAARAEGKQTSGAAGSGEPPAAAGLRAATDDDIPMFSRITDDYVTAGGAPSHASLGGIDVLGGGRGVGGGGSRGRGAGGFEGGEFFGGWDPQALVEAIWRWLPTALALSLALPPAAVQQLIQVSVRARTVTRTHTHTYTRIHMQAYAHRHACMHMAHTQIKVHPRTHEHSHMHAHPTPMAVHPFVKTKQTHSQHMVQGQHVCL